MPNEPITPQKAALLKSLQETGAVNFEQIGKIVQEVGSQLVGNPGVVAADYIATGVDSVVHVWKTGLEGKLDEVATLRENIRQVLGP